MAKKRKKKHNYMKFISDIRINTRVLCILLALILAIGIMFAGMMIIVLSQRKDNKKELEQSVMVSTEQYMDTAVDNMISIAKTVYTNEALYDFLNKRYTSTVEYYDAYYDFSQSRFLIVTEDSSVKNFKIYTANETVTNGGNISRLDSVADEEWYIRFSTLKKDMIIYCDTESRNLSLIRKLNYKSVQTGETIFKLDFNMANFQECLRNLSFDGSVYLMSGDMLLYSNHKDLRIPDTDVLANGMKLDRNYYTCDINYYVCGNKKDIFSVLVKPITIGFAIVFVGCQVFIVVILLNFKNRIKEVYDVCATKKVSQKVYYGEDEIGKLYNNLKNIIVDVKRLSDEKRNLKLYFDEYMKNTNGIIISALNYNTQIRLGLDNEQANTIIPLCDEILNVSRSLDALRNRSGFRYTLISDTEANEKTILPYSLSEIALHLAEYDTAECEMEIDIREHGGCYRVRFYKPGIFMNSAELLRLRAIFEPDGERNFLKFDPDDEYNPYIRLSRFYGDDISIVINSKEEIDLEFVIKNKAE